MALSKRDQAYFCVVGTLVAMAVVVYQGDYEGYHRAALASVPWSNANLDQGNLLITSTKYTADNMAFAPAGTQTGHRTTPGSGDPYAYIRTGTYPKILAHEAEVANAWASGLKPAPIHALNLNPAPPKVAAAAAKAPERPAKRLNVQAVSWAHGESESGRSEGNVHPLQKCAHSC